MKALAVEPFSEVYLDPENGMILHHFIAQERID